MSNIDSNNFFHTAIKCTCPNVQEIKHIKSCPPGKPIFLAETHKSEPIVFKFVDHNIAIRDQGISQLLVSKGLPVPTIKISGYVAQWYETYKFNPCKTLNECIKNMLDDDKIFNIYKQTLDIQAKLSETNLDEIGKYKGRYFVDVYKITAPATRPKAVTAIYSIVIKYLSQRHNIRLQHNDLHGNNILCNPDGTLNQIIDLTGVSLSSEEFAMSTLLNYFPLPDLSDELMDYYDSITGRKLDRKFIYRTLKLLKLKRTLKDKASNVKQAFQHKKVR